MSMTIQQQAEKSYKNKDYQKAADLYLQAALLPESEVLHAAEMKNNASVSFLLAHQPQQALDVVTGTSELFLQANDRKRSAMALGNQASALEALGRFSEAMPLYVQAAETLKELQEPELRSYVLKKISALQIKTGKQFEALGSMAAALDDAPTLSPKEKTLKKLTDWVSKLMRR
ncbi:MAG: hypothetical protein CVU39_06395 [Chloroflexi bacterium HGW-Chloroflexi-10]|nr:MAG: hypothetical protein CVU39_06395 [Chloroflexi bacterium HGW-Chloroflexi-10]